MDKKYDNDYLALDDSVGRKAASAAKQLQSCPTLCDPIDGSPPGSSLTGFSRQEYWSGLPFPSQRRKEENINEGEAILNV